MLALYKTPSEWLFGTAFEAPCDTVGTVTAYNPNPLQRTKGD